MTTHRIRRIAPLQTAKIAAVLYAVIGLILFPIFLAVSRLAPGAGGTWSGIGMGFAIAVPLAYAAFGFVGTLIAAALYNLVAGWVGGIEVEVESVA